MNADNPGHDCIRRRQFGRVLVVVIVAACAALIIGLAVYQYLKPALPLHEVVINYPDGIVSNIEWGHDPNGLDERGLTPMWYAVRFHKTRSVRILLEHGADPNRHRPGDSFLAFAARKNMMQIARMLLEYKADPNGLNLGFTGLELATQRGYEAMVELLLEHGANPNLTTVLTGETPLHMAAKGDNLRIVQLLLKHGADPLKQDRDGNAPADVARQFSPNTEILAVLESAAHAAEVDAAATLR